MKARTVKQVSIFIENKPGVFGEIGAMLAAKDVNLKAISVADSLDHAVVRLVTSQPDLAREILHSADIVSLEHEVLELNMEDKPGALAEYAAKLAENGVNIEYAYGSSPADSSQGFIIIRVDQPQKALDIATNM